MKRNSILGLLLVCGALAMSASEADAQGLTQGQTVQGMLGPRVLGRPLQAPPRVYMGGIQLGPSGDFVGIGRGQGGTMFGSTPRATSVPLPPGGILPPGLYGPPTPAQLSLPEAVGQAALMGPGASQLGPSATAPPQQGLQAPGATVPMNQPFGPMPPVGGPPAQGATPPGAGTTGPAPAATTPGATPPAQWLRTSGPTQTPGASAPAPSGSVPPAPAAETVRPIPPQLTIGFTPAPTAGVSSATLSSMLEGTRELQRRSPLSVTVKNDTATLRGRVATEHDRALAEALLLLDPGIWHVQNDLVVEARPGASQGASAR